MFENGYSNLTIKCINRETAPFLTASSRVGKISGTFIINTHFFELTQSARPGSPLARYSDRCFLLYQLKRQFIWLFSNANSDTNSGYPVQPKVDEESMVSCLRDFPRGAYDVAGVTANIPFDTTGNDGNRAAVALAKANNLSMTDTMVETCVDDRRLYKLDASMCRTVKDPKTGAVVIDKVTNKPKLDCTQTDPLTGLPYIDRRTGKTNVAECRDFNPKNCSAVRGADGKYLLDANNQLIPVDASAAASCSHLNDAYEDTQKPTGPGDRSTIIPDRSSCPVKIGEVADYSDLITRHMKLFYSTLNENLIEYFYPEILSSRVDLGRVHYNRILLGFTKGRGIRCSFLAGVGGMGGQARSPVTLTTVPTPLAVSFRPSYSLFGTSLKSLEGAVAELEEAESARSAEEKKISSCGTIGVAVHEMGHNLGVGLEDEGLGGPGTGHVQVYPLGQRAEMTCIDLEQHRQEKLQSK